MEGANKLAGDKILAERDGPVGRVIFNNPERHNAVSLDMWAEVSRILREYEADDGIRVIVFTGAGGKAFVSGADISKFEDERATEEAVKNYSQKVSEAYDSIMALTKPTIAMIRGYCIGGGMGLAVSCNLRICTEESSFGVPAAKLGLGYGFDKVRVLTDLVGPSFAMEIFYTARRFTAREAEIMGLVNRVVPDGELESYVQETSETIAGNAPLTVGAIKKIVTEIYKDPGVRDEEICAQMVQACFDSEDYIEGRRAFMEKRKPQFKGK